MTVTAKPFFLPPGCQADFTFAVMARSRRRIAAGALQSVTTESQDLNGRPIRLVGNDNFVPEPAFQARFDFILAYGEGHGALLLVLMTGRSQHREAGVFSVLARVGNGSEIESLIVGDGAAAVGRGAP